MIINRQRLANWTRPTPQRPTGQDDCQDPRLRVVVGESTRRADAYALRPLPSCEYVRCYVKAGTPARQNVWHTTNAAGANDAHACQAARAKPASPANEAADPDDE